ncbi:hypothetical protein O1B78_000666 [Vibrio cholerae]|uniref:hypothetical protein n=1 Tax=Vibrio cholerae TaxID=666 RepID=UPI0015838413|nr:hypothetical protein [Vibrio cholerae]EKF9416558.1 hypothetical protein [Vibrio cholerae]QKU81927.1 hypothetical protein HPY07_05380 [Vibrio cholerae]
MIRRILPILLTTKLNILTIVILSCTPSILHANPIFSRGITNAYSLVEKNSFSNRAEVILFGKISWDKKSDHYVLIDETGLVYLSPKDESELKNLSRSGNQVKIIGIVNKKSKAMSLEILDLQKINQNI